MSPTPPTRRRVSLNWLLEGIAPIAPPPLDIGDLHLDSREATAGSLFFALPGARSHGVEFAAQAVGKGAIAVLWEPAPGVAAPLLAPAVFVAAVPGLSRLVGRIADRFFDRPSAQMDIAGITGTNGKTTCAYLLAECLDMLRGDSAYLGTLGVGPVGALRPTSHTTPDAVSVQRELATLRAAKLRRVAMEVSSHALDQHRVDGVRFRFAAFTNLTRDHLDYHGSMQAYGAAKALLFAREELAHAVINVDDAFGRELARRTALRVPVLAVGMGGEDPDFPAQQALFARQVSSDRRGLTLHVDGGAGPAVVRAALIGRFNAENLLIVLGLLLCLGVPMSEAVAAIARCRPPPGRMETVGGGDLGPLAVIDYAHTPDALSKALRAAREHCSGALWCVFGCGGDRDAGKRPLMGAVADELADHIIITDDNPRSEEPRRIAEQIKSAISTHAARVIHDRREAIRTALAEARPRDLVLIAGKGHEEHQTYGDRRVPFSDKLEVERHFGAAA